MLWCLGARRAAPTRGALTCRACRHCPAERNVIGPYMGQASQVQARPKQAEGAAYKSNSSSIVGRHRTFEPARRQRRRRRLFLAWNSSISSSSSLLLLVTCISYSLQYPPQRLSCSNTIAAQTTSSSIACTGKWFIEIWELGC